MRALVRSEVEVAASAETVWDYVTDWPRQGEWIPLTRVETVGPAHQVGGRIRAWTGLGPLGVWDPMTITAWEPPANGSARCEVMHTGAVVRGEAEFTVVARGTDACTFTWWEHLAIPGGPVGAVLWRLFGPGMRKVLDLSVRRMATRAEALRATG